MRSRSLIVGVFSFLIALTVGTAMAEAETIQFVGVGPASVVTVGGSNSANYHGSVWAGELTWQWLGTPPDGFAQTFYSYCVDLANTVQSQQTVTPVSSTGFTNGVTNGGAKAAWLFNEFAAGIHTMSNTTLAAINAAALQIAIWEAMYDTSANLTSGGFTATASNTQITTQASTYLNALYAAQPWQSVATILSTAVGQDQIVSRVSEPSTLMMMGVAFFVISALARRTTVRQPE